jgi:hypothetical protein
MISLAHYPIPPLLAEAALALDRPPRMEQAGAQLTTVLQNV